MYELADAEWAELHGVAAPETVGGTSIRPAAAATPTGTSFPSQKHMLQGDSAGARDWVYDLPLPPPHLVYRKINPAQCEVTCDIFDIAGRVYSDLDAVFLDADMDELEDEEFAEGLDEEGKRWYEVLERQGLERVTGLMGLADSEKVCAQPQGWNGEWFVCV